MTAVIVLRATLTSMICMALAGGASAGTLADLSPAKYRGYSCHQLLQEGHAVSLRAGELAGEKSVAVANGTEATIALPAILDSEQKMTGELAVLRRQLEAIEEAAIQSQCEIEFVPATNK